MCKKQKTVLKTLFKQLNDFRKTVDKEKAKNALWYRSRVREIISGMRTIIRSNIKIENYTTHKDWCGNRQILIGNMFDYDYVTVKNYYKDSVLVALKENNQKKLFSKESFLVYKGKYFPRAKYFIDNYGKLRDYATYYKGNRNQAYKKDEFVRAQNNRDIYFRKDKEENIYNKKIPYLSSIAIEKSRWSNLTKEFFWSLFKYDGKALPVPEKGGYGFTFKKIEKLKFSPNPEQLKILKEISGVTEDMEPNYDRDDFKIAVKIYCREKRYAPILDFMSRIGMKQNCYTFKNINQLFETLTKVSKMTQKDLQMEDF